MPRNQRIKTKYAGVYFIEGRRAGRKNDIEKIYYIVYRINGQKFEEKAGRQFRDDMTAARAAALRGSKIEGHRPPNTIKRAKEKREKAGRWTFNQLWTEYGKTKPGKAFKTDCYRYDCHLKNTIGSKQPRELILLDIERIKRDLAKNFAPGTVRSVLEMVRRIANFGADCGLCAGLSFKIKTPEVKSAHTEYLTKAQATRLFKCIDEDIKRNKWPHIGAMLKMVLFSGMRRGELFRLQWRDVDFDRNFITLRNTKSGEDKEIPLSDSARELLTNHPKTKGSAYVFPGKDGDQMTFISYYTRSIKRCSGLPANFRPLHGLRHAYASMIASSGKVTMYELQNLMTHGSAGMTQRYAKLYDNVLIKAANVASMESYTQ